MRALGPFIGIRGREDQELARAFTAFTQESAQNVKIKFNVYPKRHDLDTIQISLSART